MRIELDTYNRGFILRLREGDEVNRECSSCENFIKDKEEFYFCESTRRVFCIDCHQKQTNKCFKKCRGDSENEHEHLQITQVIKEKK